MVDIPTYDETVREGSEVWCPVTDEYCVADVICWHDHRVHGRWFECPLCHERHEADPEAEG